MKDCMITIVVKKFIQNEKEIIDAKQLLDKLSLGAYHNRLNVEGTTCSISYIKIESGHEFKEVDD